MDIRGLHHVTSIASDPAANNRFFTDRLGLRRVKQTVNFDAPEVYHLYYGDALGTPGTVMTHFPFPGSRRGTPGTGEVARTFFSVPEGSLPFWRDRLSGHGAEEVTRFGENRLHFRSNDGESFALVETPADARDPWTGNGVDAAHAIRGFRGVSMRLQDDGATRELMRSMGYAHEGEERDTVRFRAGNARANEADIVEIERAPSTPPGQQGAGSVHHVAFAVPDRAAQLAVRQALGEQGFAVTPVIDRDYFWAIYFRTPGGVLFEVATNEPGFDRDEPQEHLGETLKLPTQHEHLRDFLEKHLAPLDA